MFIVKHAQRFKGPSPRKFRTLSTKKAFKCRMLKVKQLTLLGITTPLLLQLQLIKNNLNHYSPLKTMFTI